MENLSCDWGSAFFLIFSSNVPEFIYYSHFLPLVSSLILGFVVFINNPRGLTNRILFFITLMFACWTYFDLVLWASPSPEYVIFFWASIVPVEMLMYTASFYLVSVFANNQNDISFKEKVFIACAFVPIVLLMHTPLNVQGLAPSCDQGAIEGPLIQYMYAVEVVFIVAILYILFRSFKNSIDRTQRAQVLGIGLGTVIFLTAFTLGNVILIFSINPAYEQYKLFGMPVFVAFVAYSILRFKSFNVKLITAQVLSVTLSVLILSLVFIENLNVIHIVTGITFCVVSILGYVLVRGVKKEIALRESLELSNTNQTNLIYVMNHQIKGRLGNIKNVFAEILGGDYGAVPQDARPLLQKGLDEIETGIGYVQNILKGASAANSGLQYKMESIDFSEVVTDAVSSLRAKALSKGLNLHYTTVPGIYTIQGDKVQLGEALHNLIDNSINYTLEGSIDISIESTKKEVVFKIKDTGIGLSEKDKSSLFKTGGRGEESLSYNVNSTGYGLVFVKSVAEAHKGSVLALSEGRGHGSTFIIHLPR